MKVTKKLLVKILDLFGCALLGIALVTGWVIIMSQNDPVSDYLGLLLVSIFCLSVLLFAAAAVVSRSEK